MIEKISIGRGGTITLPEKKRQRFGLALDDELILEATDKGLLLRPATAPPIELYSDERIAEFAEDDAAVGAALDRLGVK